MQKNRAKSLHPQVSGVDGDSAVLGEPHLIRPRLGQGAFRVLVTDIYRRRCAVTQERTLPALEAAHIRPYGDGGTHEARNGLLLRRDIHSLFDAGYVTVTPDLRFEVSRRIREEFENGIRARKIDVIVVYKVDRLTRSLADFAKLVELFDSHSVSFVSVTQQFNTTTSMGRLTLNVLLSFAQFEREATSDRIRDKIAASKRKGLWVGGMAPLGYDTKDRRITVNEPEAE